MEMITEIVDILETNGLDANPKREGSTIVFRGIELFMCGDIRTMEIYLLDGLTSIHTKVYFDLINEKKKEKLELAILKYNSKNPYRFTIDSDGYLILNFLAKHVSTTKAVVELEKFILTCLANQSDIKKIVNF